MFLCGGPCTSCSGGKARSLLDTDRPVSSHALHRPQIYSPATILTKPSENPGANCARGQFRDRFRFFHVESDRGLIDTIAGNLELGRKKVGELFGVDIDILFFNVFVCPSRSVFDRFVQSITKTPTGSGRIGQTQGHDMYMLSPNAYREEAPFYASDKAPFYDEVELRHNLAHEFVHVWEELNSPKAAMDARPSWFSEGMAMYISQSNEEKEFHRRIMADYRRGIVPKPDDISGERSYTWGCVLFEYIMKLFGPDRILHIVRETSDENVMGLLGDKNTITEGYMMYLPDLRKG